MRDIEQTGRTGATAPPSVASPRCSNSDTEAIEDRENVADLAEARDRRGQSVVVEESATTDWTTWIEEDLPSAEDAKWFTHSAARARELRRLAAVVQQDDSEN